MKKYAIVETIGNWERKEGKVLIYGTVKQAKLYADSNDMAELLKKCPKEIEYREDGTWHNYSVNLRRNAKRELAMF